MEEEERDPADQKGSIKEPTKRVTLPMDIAAWITQPEAMEQVRRLMHKHRVA